MNAEDVGPFERHGYQSRFGDGRDRYVEQPVFHRPAWMVASAAVGEECKLAL